MIPTYIRLGDDWDLEIDTTPRKNISIDLTWGPCFSDSDVRYHITKCDTEEALRIADECDRLLNACKKAEPYKVALKTRGHVITYLCSWEQSLPALLVSDADLQIRIPFIAHNSIRNLQDLLRKTGEVLV